MARSEYQGLRNRGTLRMSSRDFQSLPLDPKARLWQRLPLMNRCIWTIDRGAHIASADAGTVRITEHLTRALWTLLGTWITAFLVKRVI